MEREAKQKGNDVDICAWTLDKNLRRDRTCQKWPHWTSQCRITILETESVEMGKAYVGHAHSGHETDIRGLDITFFD